MKKKISRATVDKVDKSLAAIGAKIVAGAKNKKNIQFLLSVFELGTIINDRERVRLS